MTYTPPEQPGQPSGGYQPYQPAGQQPYGFAAAPASTKKTLSLWGLILGISSIVIPIWINAIAGAVLSGIGLAKEPQGKTMAIWGLVTSVLLAASAAALVAPSAGAQDFNARPNYGTVTLRAGAIVIA